MIGMTACIMDDAVVETGAMVAAGAFVTPKKVVGAGEVWAGRPAKFWRMMSEQDFSQISITRDKRLIGSLNESHLYTELMRKPGVKREPVESIMQPAFPFADVSTPIDLLSTMITPENPAVLVRDFQTSKTFIITRSDVIRVL